MRTDVLPDPAFHDKAVLGKEILEPGATNRLLAVINQRDRANIMDSFRIGASGETVFAIKGSAETQWIDTPDWRAVLKEMLRLSPLHYRKVVNAQILVGKDRATARNIAINLGIPAQPQSLRSSATHRSQ